MAPARTGKERSKRIVVIKIDQTNKGSLFHPIFLFLIFIIVTKKFIDPIIELAPAKWRLKIAMSTEVPEWAIAADKGGYTVHPVPAPLLARVEPNNKNNAGRSNQ